MAAFNIGLSGVQAASKDLEVTGNNVANASTVGFKASRAEFGDFYASAMLGLGRTQQGGGVLTENVGQKFLQGGFTTTGNTFDLAIDGQGFYQLENNSGQTSYTRAGYFEIDKEGFVVNNYGAKLQGYQADNDGNVSGIIGDINLPNSDLPPANTSLVSSEINVDSRELVLSSQGSAISTTGQAIAVAQAGIANDTRTTFTTGSLPQTTAGETLFSQNSQFTGTNVALPLTITAAVNDVLTINMTDITGAVLATSNITITPGVYTNISALKNEINTQIAADGVLANRVVASNSGSSLVMQNMVSGETLSFGGVAQASVGLATSVQSSYLTSVDFRNITGVGAVTQGTATPTTYAITAAVNDTLTMSFTDAGGVNNTIAMALVPTASVTLAGLVTSLQNNIDANFGAGLVSVSSSNNRLVFESVAPGALTNITFPVPGEQAAQDFGIDLTTTVPGIDTRDYRTEFTVQLVTPDPSTSGTALITLDELFTSTQQMAASINRQIAALSTADAIGVTAIAVESPAGSGQFQLEFQASVAGEASQINILGQNPAVGLGATYAPVNHYGYPQGQLLGNILDNLLQASGGSSTPGIAGVDNGYPAQAVTLELDDGTTRLITTVAGASANETAVLYNTYPGVTASATTVATLPVAGYNNPNGNMTFALNGVALLGANFTDIAAEINNLTNSTLPGISAVVDAAGDLVITSSVGVDLQFDASSSDPTDSLRIQGNALSAPATIGNGTNFPPSGVVGGSIDLVLAEGYTLSNPVPPFSGLWGNLLPEEFTAFTINAFDPLDQRTYNHATSTTIYDSLGNDHVMTQYYVKEDIDPADPARQQRWSMYMLIDGEDVGDPDANLTPPENILPTRAQYDLYFNPDGTMDTVRTQPILISNWTPKDSDGNSNGSLAPDNVASGGQLPIPQPATSSNFEVRLDNYTQYGSNFAVRNSSQDGYAVGRVDGLTVDRDGTITGTFTNGLTRTLAQIAIGSFRNLEGLQPIGDTAWQESAKSGNVTMGVPGTATLGIIRAGALEDSTVDLSTELVHMILAQRNFQASAKTIETADAVTQTIINIR